jgi:photosystem II stability/assembly factor-like uncharacterized protein
MLDNTLATTNRAKGTTLSKRVILLAVASLLLGVCTSAANIDQIDYNKYELDSAVGDMMWCGKDNEVILVLTGKGSIYRSRDRGNSWKKLQSLMAQVGVEVAD